MIATLFEKLFDFVAGIFNIAWAILCIPVYGMIRNGFNIFIKITSLDLLSDTNISGIYQRVTMIITIVMVFYITFEFVKYAVLPDTIADKEKGAESVVKRIIISILLVAFVPKFFSLGYKFQSKVIESQLFSKVILGKENWDYSSAGSVLAADTFSAFFYVDYENCDNNCDDAQEKVDSVIENIREDGGTIHIFKTIWKQIGSEIEFHGLFALAFGCFVIYVLFLYSIDVGIRYAQLLFLQIIAPIAIISYIAPQKDGLFKKWGKQCITTYIDLFIRISIIYFMLLLIQILGENFSIFKMTSNGDRVGVFVYLFLVAGLLIFAQKAPKMLKELFPKAGGEASIGFGFEGKTRTEPLGKSINAIKKPIAATAGAVAGLARVKSTMVKGGVRTLFKAGDKGWKKALTAGYSAAKAGYAGAKQGAKTGRFKDATSAARTSVQKDEDVVNKGGTVLGHDLRGSHFQDVQSKIKLRLGDLEAVTKAKSAVSTAVGDVKVIKTFTSYKDEWKERGIGDASVREKALKEMEKASRTFAVSDRGENAQKALEATIKRTVESVYGIPAEKYDGAGHVTNQAEIAVAIANAPPTMKETIINLTSNMDVNSVKWNKIQTEITEARRVAEGQVYGDKSNMMRDSAGNMVPAPTNVSDIDLTKFAQDIGDVSDSAEAEATRVKYEEETREANANANGTSEK